MRKKDLGLAGRRDFLLGGGAFFAASGAPGGMFAGAGDAARLRIGVLSDLHINAEPNACEPWEQALKFFRDRKVDAVIVAGDIACGGQLAELKKAGNVWRKVFPGNKRPDGGHVEKVFVTGNHDVNGWKYKQNEGNPNAASNAVGFRLAEAWRDAFGEEYSPMYIKNVKGYSFIGAHFDLDGTYHKEGAIASFLVLPGWEDIR